MAQEKKMDKGEQRQTYRLPGVQADDGSTGTLVFTVKPGGNAHAEFEPDIQEAAPVDPNAPAPDNTLPGDQPQAGQLPA